MSEPNPHKRTMESAEEPPAKHPRPPDLLHRLDGALTRLGINVDGLPITVQESEGHLLLSYASVVRVRLEPLAFPLYQLDDEWLELPTEPEERGSIVKLLSANMDTQLLEKQRQPFLTSEQAWRRLWEPALRDALRLVNRTKTRKAKAEVLLAKSSLSSGERREAIKLCFDQRDTIVPQILLPTRQVGLSANAEARFEQLLDLVNEDGVFDHERPIEFYTLLGSNLSEAPRAEVLLERYTQLEQWLIDKEPQDARASVVVEALRDKLAPLCQPGEFKSTNLARRIYNSMLELAGGQAVVLPRRVDSTTMLLTFLEQQIHSGLYGCKQSAGLVEVFQYNPAHFCFEPSAPSLQQWIDLVLAPHAVVRDWLIGNSKLLQTILELLLNSKAWHNLAVQDGLLAWQNGLYDVRNRTFYATESTGELRDSAAKYGAVLKRIDEWVGRPFANHYLDKPFRRFAGRWVVTNPNGKTFLEMAVQWEGEALPLDCYAQDQNWDSETAFLFHASLGRLLNAPLARVDAEGRRVHIDNWKCSPMLNGAKNCGKSTILEWVESYFPPHLVAHLNSGLEPNFPLQSTVGCLLVLFDEVENLSKALDADQWKLILEQQYVNIKRKNLKELLTVFGAAVLTAGNGLPEFPDPERAIAFRQLVFPMQFEVPAQRRDPLLLQKLRDLRDLLLDQQCAAYLLANQLLESPAQGQPSTGRRDLRQLLDPRSLLSHGSAGQSEDALARFLAEGPYEVRRELLDQYVRLKPGKGDLSEFVPQCVKQLALDKTETIQEDRIAFDRFWREYVHWCKVEFSWMPESELACPRGLRGLRDLFWRKHRIHPYVVRHHHRRNDKSETTLTSYMLFGVGPRQEEACPFEDGFDFEAT